MTSRKIIENFYSNDSKNMFESSLQNETPILQPIIDNQFFFETFSSHMKFNVVSVDCQHTLWNVPTAKNDNYFTNYGQTLYWNYDLRETVKKAIPKSDVQKMCDTMKKIKWIIYRVDF